MIEFIATHRGRPICQTFKDLAARTWDYLDEGARIGMPPGEETLTDENLMAILALYPSQVAIWRMSKKRESQLGADWEWWFGNPADGWFGMRVQAKKIDLKLFTCYSGVDHPNHTCQQIDCLIRESQAAGLFPAYCLYNTRLAPRLSEWGCGITSAHVMLGALKQPQAKKSHTVAFRDIERYMFPWHKLVCHPERGDTGGGGFPRAVRSAVLPGLPQNDRESVPGTHSELPDYARKLVAVVTDSLENKMVPTVDPVDVELPAHYLVVVSDQPIFPRFLLDEERPMRE